ncbi:helix-turn-helix domain-containing protein [Lactobacillus bombicola]|uniref:helix-turn-helix domain-containing protein n=1 Tax=Lactobacillus bombicola TaxID=1505723 RepID=UPI00217529EC|nr:helix-turn-helix transcriptional regulator [Lactobacillus bombicola]
MMWKVIQKELNKKHWSMKTLSKISGVKYDNLVRYKSGKRDPGFSKVCKIADALEISLDELRERKEEN